MNEQVLRCMRGPIPSTHPFCLNHPCIVFQISIGEILDLALRRKYFLFPIWLFVNFHILVLEVRTPYFCHNFSKALSCGNLLDVDVDFDQAWCFLKTMWTQGTDRQWCIVVLVPFGITNIKLPLLSHIFLCKCLHPTGQNFFDSDKKCQDILYLLENGHKGSLKQRKLVSTTGRDCKWWHNRREIRVVCLPRGLSLPEDLKIKTGCRKHCHFMFFCRE